MRLAFLGTPEFAAKSLAEIASSGHEVIAAYTQPPRPAKRGQAVSKSPVHLLAEALGIETRTPASFKDADVLADFKALALDLACVVAYGQILPQAALDAPRLGCVNLHGSLLPRWRGAAPIQRAIMAGDVVTGVQLMQMEAGLDTGPVLLSQSTPITAQDTAQTLHDRLADLGAKRWGPGLAALERGSLQAAAQADHGVTYAKKIDKAEARLDWSQPADVVDRTIRGLSPFPGAWFEWPAPSPFRVKALMSEVVSETGEPGALIGPDLRIACGSGAVRLITVQREGKRPQSAETFLNGLQGRRPERVA
ncbi:MAG: methionyl-tRNA formyltransferase [Maricaulaceae bacterium]